MLPVCRDCEVLLTHRAPYLMCHQEDTMRTKHKVQDLHKILQYAITSSSFSLITRATSTSQYVNCTTGSRGHPADSCQKALTLTIALA